MNYRVGLIAWASVSVVLFILIGFVIYVSGALWPLWFLILPFLTTISSTRKEEESEGK